MSVTIRLARHGRKKRPFYRIVATDKQNPRDGRYLEQVGIYNPLNTPKTIVFEGPKMEAWLQNGGLPSPTVELLYKQFKLQQQGRENG
ncbi:MAG: 30S ribosomal protein S16 [Deltaproteobacteria bacterium RIFOXYA12_FULL_61_11]|nr:MAG: 30S ribosomal protein S16 [Deltaproteobacteria bacterium RIFOXYA12_FULL_61_11]